MNVSKPQSPDASPAGPQPATPAERPVQPRLTLTDNAQPEPRRAPMNAADRETAADLRAGALAARRAQRVGPAVPKAAVIPAGRAPLTSRAPVDLARVPTPAVAPAPVGPALVGPVPKAPKPFRPPVSASTMRARHFGLIFSFLLAVVVPMAVSGWYLWTRATDQYASYIGFSVQKEDTDPAVALLGGISSLSTSSSSDTDILYEYMYSQSLVAEIDAQLDLRNIWSKAEQDPWFSYASPGTIEDLTDHWKTKVKVYYDSHTRLIEVRVLAFDPVDAQAIATAIYDKSTRMINGLAEIAREDSVRYAKEELDISMSRLKSARTAMTEYRNRNRLVDPTADVASQSGLLANLQAQLAEALIELDSLRLSTQATDPRIPPAERKVSVIEDRIDAERSKLGSGGGVDAEAYAQVVAEYEGLAADREFAELSYQAALSSYDSALADARRQGRYLAAHISPTRAESSRFPERPILFGLVSLFSFVLWSIAALLYYSLRDRR